MHSSRVSYRACYLGHRRIHGLLVPQGAIIERYSNADNRWVYVDCMHPADAEQFIKSHENLPTQRPDHG